MSAGATSTTSSASGSRRSPRPPRRNSAQVPTRLVPGNEEDRVFQNGQESRGRLPTRSRRATLLRVRRSVQLSRRTAPWVKISTSLLPRRARPRTSCSGLRLAAPVVGESFVGTENKIYRRLAPGPRVEPSRKSCSRSAPVAGISTSRLADLRVPGCSCGAPGCSGQLDGGVGRHAVTLSGFARLVSAPSGSGHGNRATRWR